MKFSKQEIIKKFENYVNVLTVSKNEEKDLKRIDSYNRHLDKAYDLIKQLQIDSIDFSIVITDYYNLERRQYGWEFLPNENGRIAELEFWKLMKDLNLYKGKI